MKDNRKQFLYKLKVTRLEMLTDGPSLEEGEVLADHMSYLQRLSADGTVLMAGRTQTADESTFGIVIFLAESEEDAVAVMNRDPAVSEGLMSATLFPYAIATVSAKILEQ